MHEFNDSAHICCITELDSHSQHYKCDLLCIYSMYIYIKCMLYNMLLYSCTYSLYTHMICIYLHVYICMYVYAHVCLKLAEKIRMLCFLYCAVF